MKKTAGDSGSLHVLFGRAYRDAGDMPSARFESFSAPWPRSADSSRPLLSGPCATIA